MTVTGDITCAQVDALILPVNTIGIMSRGAGLRLKASEPGLFEAYRKACRTEFPRGGVAVYPVPGRYDVVFFPVKRHYRDSVDPDLVAQSLSAFAEACSTRGYRRLALPRMKAGLGRMRWSDMLEQIRRALEGLGDVELQIYEDE